MVWWLIQDLEPSLPWAQLNSWSGNQYPASHMVKQKKRGGQSFQDGMQSPTDLTPDHVRNLPCSPWNSVFQQYTLLIPEYIISGIFSFTHLNHLLRMPLPHLTPSCPSRLTADTTFSGNASGPPQFGLADPSWISHGVLVWPLSESHDLGPGPDLSHLSFLISKIG